MGVVIPTLTQIGAINRARTASGGFDSDTLGTFTTDTRPTAAEVTVLAGLAADQVADTLGNAIPDEFATRAQGAAALYAAALVEASTDDPRTALIDQWSKAADTRVTAIAKEMGEVGAGNAEGPSDNALMPAYGFPAVCPLPPIF